MIADTLVFVRTQMYQKVFIYLTYEILHFSKHIK